MRRSVVFFIILFSILQYKPYLDGPDSVSYYMVAESISFERNLMFDNEFKAADYPMTISPTYHVIEYHHIGVSLIWMLFADLLKYIGFGNKYMLNIFINLLEYIFGILAVICIFKAAEKLFDKQNALLSVLAVLFGTNLFAYLTFFTGASHAANIFFIAVFFLFYLNTRKERKNIDWFILGGLAGLALITRGESVLYLLLPAYDLLIHLKNKKLRQFFFGGSLFISGLILTFSPQLAFWKIIYGKLDISFGEYDYFKGRRFLDVLFHCTRGFFFFSPLIGLCFLIGLWRSYKLNKPLAVIAGIIFAGIVYLTGIRKFSWNAGASFGGRYFLVFSPLLVLSVTAYFTRLSFKNKIIIIIVSSVWSSFLLGLWHHQGDFYCCQSIFDAFTLSYVGGLFKSMVHHFKYAILKYIALKCFFSIIVFFVIFLLWRLYLRIKMPKSLQKRIFIYLVAAIIGYIHMIFLECYRNDKEAILNLQKQGFYDNAVFGEFHKHDIAGEYRDSAGEEMFRGRIEPAIMLARRARYLYPPSQEESFDFLYDFQAEAPELFREVFLKNPDPFDALGLSVISYEKGDFKNTKYYLQEALKIKPDIIAAAKKNRRLNPYIAEKLFKIEPLLKRIER